MKKPVSTALILFLFILFSTVSFPSMARQTGQTYHQVEAEALNRLGLLLGGTDGFELDRAPTRAEGSVMLVRLLGKEKEAKEANYNHPFTDVPEWLNPYVGFLYHNNLTKGVGNNLFDPYSQIDANSFATFVLRALGYSDKDGDFVWDKAVEKAKFLDIIDEAYEKQLSEKTFLRDDMVAISYNALTAWIKNSNITLAEKLMQENVISYDTAKEIKLLDKIAAKPKLTKVILSDMEEIKNGFKIFRITVDRNTLPEKMKDFNMVETGGGPYFNNTTMLIAQRAAENDTTEYYRPNVEGDSTTNKWAIYNSDPATVIVISKDRKILGYAVITDKVHNNTTLYLEFKEVTEPEYLEQITSGISIDEKGLIHFDRAKLPEKSRQFKKIFIINAYAERYPTVEELDIINVGEMAKYFYSEKIYNCDGSVFDPGIYTGHFNKKDLIVYLLDENNNPLGYYRVNENEAENMNKSVSSAAKEYMNEYRKQKSIPVIDLKGIFHFVYEDDPYKIEIINEIVRMQALDKNISRFAIVECACGHAR